MGVETSKHANTFLPNDMDFGKLENMLQEPSVTPICLPVEFLKVITRDFSADQELGRGGFGVVYKGMLQNGKMIAVKKLFEMGVEDDQFQNEVTYLIGVKHQNIVQLVGYCAESRWEATRVGGRYVMAEIRKRLLCFEYLKNNSLDKHISAESCGLEWRIRYDIIKGVCSGLHYLHAECRIVHLDLKPQNILLDDSMVPKLADFGMSRLFGQQESRVITESRGGTLGYMAPEYINNGVISTKSDIFSLGTIIIELLTGSREYPQSSETPFEHFIENVIANWRHRLEKTLSHRALLACSEQINRCIVLGLNCFDLDPHKRPSARDILQTLNELESTDCCFDMNDVPAVGQESEVNTYLVCGDVNSSSLATKFDRILSRAFAPSSANMSIVFRSAPKGRRISIQAFEVANTIVKASNLIKSLSKQRIRHLKEGVLRSEGVRCLISEDYSLLSILIEDDIREEWRGFCKEVARFGDMCECLQWHNLNRYFCRHGSPLPSKNFSEEAPPSMQYLIKLAQNTGVLHQEMLALDRLERTHYVAAVPAKKHTDAIKSKRGAVKVLKRKSLWSRSMEDIVEKFVEIGDFIHHEINSAFLENHAEQSCGALRIPNNLAKTLGPTGLALHYANVILQLKTLALASPAVPQNAREALYQALPPRIKPVLHTQLRRRFPHGEKQTMTVAEVRAEMDGVLRWLVPAAESTRLYLREWAMKGMECVDVDKANWFEQDSRIGVGSMLAHADAKVSKVETLYYADKETTEGYIAELVLALHLLVSPPTDEK
ncbi:protein PSK SIMULATOR 1-like [Hordeum vulgare subsp. vulgare]|uniref:Protein kinase domain-containing protein n=1 Tax=Hordeum vulgare subsp. vulgare TaxID=112509 RepID=A0A8I6YJP1_HORVV|nr:protein PSK SIMULATOR 1-like [Hordeum vulgare subsp. vulgare]XP_044950148.1 protein PSK SIMULATOR 1-like [Hordeum vulgare subsp. vulgare]